MAGCKSRFRVSTLLVCLVSWVCSSARAESVRYGEIVQAGAVAYEAPDSESAAVRLLYIGELVPVAEKVTANLRDWYRLRVGGERSLYVPVASVGPLIAEPPATVRERDLVVRDQYPLGAAALAYGLTQGAGVMLRYLPITRAGVSINFGPMITDDGVQGTSLFYGITGYFMTGRFTPILELGYAFLMAEARRSRQRIQAIYLTAGLEWMFENGIFVAVTATYLRSTRIELLFPHDADTFVAETYEPVDAHGRSSVQRLLPGGMLGYGF